MARYGSLADGSLHFVKVEMPDGCVRTLPQAMSASGARYTDDRDLVWWTHQETVGKGVGPEKRSVPEFRKGMVPEFIKRAL